MAKKFMEFVSDRNVVFHTNNYDIAREEFIENIGGFDGLEFEEEIRKVDKKTPCDSYKSAINYLKVITKLIRKHTKKYEFTDEDKKGSTEEELEKMREDQIKWYNTLLRVFDEAENTKDHYWQGDDVFDKNIIWFIRFVNN